MTECKQLGYEKISMLSSIYLLEKKLASKPKPAPMLPPNMETLNQSTFFKTVNETEIVRQLTFLEYATYHSIQPQECLGKTSLVHLNAIHRYLLDQAWNSIDKEFKAPNICTLINNFNKAHFLFLVLFHFDSLHADEPLDCY